MEEQLVSPIVEILWRKLLSLLDKQKNVPLGRVLGVDNTELEKLKTMLSYVRGAVLLDAEKKQLDNNNVRVWLKKLKDACYDAEDVLEELEIEALHRPWKVDQCRGITRKVCDLISCSKLPSLCFTSIDSKKIKEIIEKLDAIKMEVDASGFGSNGNVPREREIIIPSSFMVASDVLGRDNDKENIIKLLMETDNISIFGASSGAGKMDVYRNSISIFGTSGIGKTTLRQEDRWSF